MPRYQDIFQHPNAYLNRLTEPLLFKTNDPNDEVVVLGELFVDGAEEGDDFLHNLSQERPVET